jgi:serpin B
MAVAMVLALAGCGSSGEGVSEPSGASEGATAQLAAKVQYHTWALGRTGQLSPILDVVNTGTSSLPLNRITVRYWFTSDGGAALRYACDYTQRGCSNVTARFVQLDTSAGGADSYLELGFTAGAGSVAPGKSSGEIQQRVYKADWSTFDQSNDWSYDGSHSALADNVRVTVHVDGQLLWGTPPSGTVVVDPGTTAVTDAEYAAFVRGTNDLGFDLLRALTAGKEANVVYSPASISYALGMAYVGAKGTTATELAHVLHSPLSAGQAATAYGLLGKELSSRDVAAYKLGDGTVKELKLRLADALWVQTGFPMESSYLDTLQTRFGAPANSLDFAGAPEPSRVTINDWVAQATADRIQDLLAQGSITSQTRLVLTNAVYFKGSWATAFVPQYTRTGAFHPLSGGDTTAQMMSTSMKQSLYYAKGDGWQLVDVPYVAPSSGSGAGLKMTIVLPDAGRFAEVRNALSGSWLDQASASAARTDVLLSLPRFKLEPAAFSLTSLLRSLGMTAAFDPAQADFTGMTSSRPLAVSDIVHKAYISVDEAGTEAAAATAIIGAGSTPGTPVSFTVNRPFVYLVRDPSGAVLFAGQVVQP